MCWQFFVGSPLLVLKGRCKVYLAQSSIFAEVVGLLDALGEHGWIPSAAPSYGGPIDDKVSVEWPMFICQKARDPSACDSACVTFHALQTPQLPQLAQDVEQIYAKETLFIGVKDQNIPGKLCICGPPDAVAAGLH